MVVTTTFSKILNFHTQENKWFPIMCWCFWLYSFYCTCWNIKILVGAMLLITLYLVTFTVILDFFYSMFIVWKNRELFHVWWLPPCFPDFSLFWQNFRVYFSSNFFREYYHAGLCLVVAEIRWSGYQVFREFSLDMFHCIFQDDNGKYNYRYLFVQLEEFPYRTLILEDNR